MDDADELEAARLAARIRLWEPVLRSSLEPLYGHLPRFDEVVEELLHTVQVGAATRPLRLRVLDAEREIDREWFHSNERIGYVAYADRFGDTLTGVAQRLDYLAELDVDYLHLMKVLRPRDGANDGGYAIVDYGDVDPGLGTRGDLEALADALHGRGISLCLDLVINHTAREHAWARAAAAGSRHHREMYLVFPDREQPDTYERTLPEVFPTMAPGNFTWEDELGGWVWTTFNTYQWDLNYANPSVFCAMFDVIVDLVNLGVDILRLDAIAFTWKRVGTNCQNQPEAHLIAQAYRALVAMLAPGVLLKAEAIVAPADLLPYLGVHEVLRDECQLAYHNQLMVMIWASLATGDARLMTEAMAALPPTPSTASWVTYLRCHDDIGWAVSDDDAARTGLSGAAHRAHLAAFYRGDTPGSWALGAPFSSNPDADDERTSGTAAALAGVSSARAGDGDVDLAVRRLLLGYALVLTFGGIPLIYMGDELALDNDTEYLDHPDLVEDSRWMHRPVMDWELARRRAEPGTVEAQVFTSLRSLIAARRECRALSTGGETFVHRYDDPAVFAFERRHPRHGRCFVVANFSDRWAIVPGGAFSYAGLVDPVVVAGEEHLRRSGVMSLAPYGFVLAAERATR